MDNFVGEIFTDMVGSYVLTTGFTTEFKKLLWSFLGNKPLKLWKFERPVLLALAGIHEEM